MGIDPLNRRAVFLDRDGVLNAAVVRNGRPHPPATACDVEILPGVLEALRRLAAEGFLLVVVTNQPDVARGTKSRDEVDAINAKLGRELGLEHFRTCFHDDGDACSCRKPSPGLLVDSAEELSIDLSRSWMVGDRWRDVEAGWRAGCKSIFIDRGYREKAPEGAYFKARSLEEAVDRILKEEGWQR